MYPPMAWLNAELDNSSAMYATATDANAAIAIPIIALKTTRPVKDGSSSMPIDISGIENSPINMTCLRPMDSDATAQGTKLIDRTSVVAANSQLTWVSVTGELLCHMR